MEILRKTYLAQLKRYIDIPLVKVITGIRKSGKSTLLKQFKAYLENELKIQHQYLIYFEFDDESQKLPYKSLQLTELIKSRIIDNQRYYIFLDEIQLVENFQKTINSLLKLKNVDLYITGSNAYMFSSKISTLLTGKTIDVHVLPFSFKEYSVLFKDLETDKRFQQYLIYGGMPGISIFKDDNPAIKQYLKMIFNDILVKDILNRHSINNTNEFINIAKYLYNTIGNIVSIRNIVNYLKSNNLSEISEPTSSNYVLWLLESLLLYKVNFSRIKGKQLLSNLSKYYVPDIGLRNAIIDDYVLSDIGSTLANIVYLELLRRGYVITVGHEQRKKEIDFVAIKNDYVVYIQVAQYLIEENRKREIGNLLSINDNHDKMILSLDLVSGRTKEGIILKNIVDWLLEENTELEVKKHV
ncbi:MAG: ATP-binding protein [Mycoplasmataceae bacterium]|nr:ATP-binding protein [Mycoplasmataceae bacterium]